MQLDADAIVYSASSRLSVIRSELSGKVVADISHSEGIQVASPLGYTSVNTRTPEGGITSVALLGYLPGQLGEPQVIQGHTLSPSDRRGVLVDTNFLKSSGLKVGDILPLLNRLQTYDFVISGEVNGGFFFFSR